MVQHHNKLQNCLVFYDLMFWYPHWLQFSFDPDPAGSKVSGSG